MNQSYLKMSKDELQAQYNAVLAEYNDIKVCELLLMNGADPNINLGKAFMCTVPTEYNSYDVFSKNSFIYRLIFFPNNRNSSNFRFS